MTLIDSHVHAFPDRLAQRVRDTLGARGGLTGSPLLPDVAQLVRYNGFDAAWILPYAHRAGVAESVNEWSAQEVTKYPWLVPGATFHPEDEDMPRLVERALVELGLRVVKLHCSVGGFSPKDPRLAALWETAADRGVPVVVHAGQESPGDTSAEELEHLAPVLETHPSLRLVLAHCGHPASRAALDLMARYENLYADLTPVWDRPVDLTADDIARFPGRILLGSDAPNCPQSVATLVERVESLGLDREQCELVLGGAAAAITPDGIG